MDLFPSQHTLNLTHQTDSRVSTTAATTTTVLRPPGLWDYSVEPVPEK